MKGFIGFYDYTVILTYLSLLSAVIGMDFAYRGNFTASIVCLFLCGFCDAFDGTVARTKKNRTEDEKAFGIQLDSLCDVIAFGVFPAFICHFMGVDGILGMAFVCFYCLCALIRLAFFNVLEINRQKVESGCNKTYRGLPVTSISILFPFIYCFNGLFEEAVFRSILYVMLLVVGFLFILDFSVPKLNVQKLIPFLNKD